MCNSPEALAARYDRFDNLDDFLNIHYANMSVLITEDDFYELAWSYVLAAHADGVHHAEVFFDPQSHTPRYLYSVNDFIRDGSIHGVGLDSSEVGFPPELFTDVFQKAKEVGLRRTAHGGEEGDVSYIKGALDSLDAERIDHGIRLVEDRGLLKEIAAKGTLLTICPLSNVYLCTIKSIASLLLREFLDSGLQFSLNSDDPAYFGGGILNNYCVV
ncbi:hypothetical protein NYO67_6991 [Aspergillus flavus]|nr:hypothetical protein NYO67_6991 [Aspergillus flavus]